MTTGTQTYDGMAVPLYGESTITQQTAATDLLTLTGAASMSGDFLVMTNSTGAEMLSISSSGYITTLRGVNVGTTLAVAGAVTLSSSITGTQMTLVVSATTTTAGLTVSITSTGAITAGDTRVNGVLVSGSSKAVMNSAYAWNGLAGDGTAVCNYFVAIHGSKAPTYFLGIGTSTVAIGTIADTGFVNTGMFYRSAPVTTMPIVGIKCLLGDSVWYIPLVPDSYLE